MVGSSVNGQQRDALVPVLERVRFMAILRSLGTVVAAVHVLVDPDAWSIAPGRALGIGAAYAVLTWLLTWRMQAEPGLRRLRAFQASLLLDGVAMGVLVLGTGWMASPLRYLFLVHALGVTLAASYRTGVKLCVWNGLVVLSISEAIAVGVLETSSGRIGNSPMWFLAALGATVAVGASGAWVNERELRRTRFVLDALATMGSRFEQLSSPAETAEVTVDTLCSTFDVDRVVVLDTDSGVPAVLGAKGLLGVPGDVEPDPSTGVLRRAVGAREVVLTSRLSPSDDAWLHALLPDAANLAFVPLVADDRLVGVLIVEHGLRLGTKVERRTHEMILRFATHAGLALANATMAAQIRDLARMDGLTGLLNRRSFDELLPTEFERAERAHGPVGLVMLDIDHFKLINDTYGHQVGDEVLRAVGRALRANTRGLDGAARYGGEEFAIVVPGADTTEVEMFGERLRRSLIVADTAVDVTVSVGVASAPGWPHDPDELIRRADAALYEAKASGRNRVRVAPPVPTRLSHAS